MTDMKWAPLQGAVVMHEKAWAGLTADQKTEVLRVTAKVGEDLRASNRDQEERSLQAMKSRGLEIVPVTDPLVTEWTETVKKAYPRVRDSLVPPAIFDEVERLRDEYRKNQAAPR
jgi:TRAP-type C4-dicarboxylate transport system substrate-binding protein